MLLTKLGDDYKLYSHDSCIATTHESPYKRLSKENCNKIFSEYITPTYSEYLNSIQQPIEIEVAMECREVKQCECSSNENCLNPQPKLDEDGCLILKKKS